MAEREVDGDGDAQVAHTLGDNRCSRCATIVERTHENSPCTVEPPTATQVGQGTVKSPRSLRDVFEEHQTPLRSTFVTGAEKTFDDREGSPHHGCPHGGPAHEGPSREHGQVVRGEQGVVQRRDGLLVRLRTRDHLRGRHRSEDRRPARSGTEGAVQRGDVTRTDEQPWPRPLDSVPVVIGQHLENPTDSGTATGAEDGRHTGVGERVDKVASAHRIRAGKVSPLGLGGHLDARGHLNRAGRCNNPHPITLDQSRRSDTSRVISTFLPRRPSHTDTVRHDEPMDLGLNGRCYVVTGGSRGLGLATARVLLDEGASVVLGARDDAVLEQASAALAHESPGRVVGIATDVADPSGAERLAAAAVARFGRLDGALVNGASPPAGSAFDTPDDVWRDAFESVFLGSLRTARAATAAIRGDDDEVTGTGGSIVFVLSTSAREPFVGLSISNGLRPGLAMLVKELADEFGPRGIRINALLPGRFATDRTFALDARSGSPEMVRRRNESLIPLGRYGEPEEFARTAAFILSPASSYVTGSLLTVDGGVLRHA